ncbi:MAG: hypothetical protein PHH04_08755 [Thomasclavelia sp.]|nr:hypothetical protein [Thomasclavelia sp.]
MLKIRNIISKLSNYKKLICLILILGFISMLSFNNQNQKEITFYNDSIKINDFQKLQSIKKNKLKLLVKEQVNLIASINVGTKSWNSLDNILETVSYNSNIAFTIEDIDELNPVEEKYYYISNSATPLNPEQITEWQTYNNEVEINTEGFYVIYAKVVDLETNISYLNTDLLILDKTKPISSIDEWNDLRTDLNYIYIDREKTLTIETNDLLSGISNVQYYISNVILNITELKALENNNWTTYLEEIIIDRVGTHIVYVKVTDNAGNVTYINTDYIVLNGYTITDLFVGRNKGSYEDVNPYITNKSSMTLKIDYSNASDEITDYNHNLISNILLPMGTKINLIDYIGEKVYEYIIPTTDDIYGYNDSCDVEDLECLKTATYPITLFKEVGTNNLFIENNYYNNGIITEEFTVVVDFINTDIINNYDNVALYMEVRDSLGNNIRPTLNNTIKKFNIYSKINNIGTKALLNLTTDYSGGPIKFNTSSTTDISITSGINYKYLNEFKVIDTTYEDNEIGLSIKLVDSEGTIVDKKHLKNIVFKVGNGIYSPESDNIVHINLNNGINDVTKTLSIITGNNDTGLKEGTYYFKISNFASYDGYYYDELNDIELTIPVEVKEPVVYSFDVIVDGKYNILSKKEDFINIPFNILQNGNLKNPNIRVSLYKKNELTAFDQGYSIVDLSMYVSNILDAYENNVYSVTIDPIDYIEPDYLFNNFELNLIMSNFENFGYKFVFELYDNNEKVGTIEKYFIVKEE